MSYLNTDYPRRRWYRGARLFQQRLEPGQIPARNPSVRTVLVRVWYKNG